MAAASGTGSPAKLSEAACHGGRQLKFEHESAACACKMKFSVFLPPVARGVKVPVVYFLSGLTCNEDNFAQKAGAQAHAAAMGLALVMPDTSPRGDGVPDDEKGMWDFGLGAGFYVDATAAPFHTNYKMETYVMDELPLAVKEAVGSSVDVSRASVMGHSMGGHGALTLALRHPGKFASVSAFSPICNPVNCPWGQKAFNGYLGGPQAEDCGTPSSWNAHDATELVKSYNGTPVTLLVDQGLEDNFLKAGQLLPEALVAAAAGNERVSVDYRGRVGYDHSYWYIQSFVAEHLAHHKAALA